VKGCACFKEKARQRLVVLLIGFEARGLDLLKSTTILPAPSLITQKYSSHSHISHVPRKGGAFKPSPLPHLLTLFFCFSRSGEVVRRLKNAKRREREGGTGGDGD
jgi:hypothetical protein